MNSFFYWDSDIFSTSHLSNGENKQFVQSVNLLSSKASYAPSTKDNTKLRIVGIKNIIIAIMILLAKAPSASWGALSLLDKVALTKSIVPNIIN